MSLRQVLELGGAFYLLDAIYKVAFLLQLLYRLFEEAEIAKFTPQEMREYETSKMAYRDIKNSVDTAKREGIAEGMEKGMKEGMELGIAKGKQKGLAEGMEKGMNQKALEIAKNMLAMGLSAEQVAKATQLPLDIIKNQNNS